MLYAVVLVLIVLALLAVSVSRSRKLKSHDDFMVADRRLSAWVLVFTLLCSWIGAGSLFAGAEFAYRRGLSSLWLPAGGWAGLLVVFFTARRARSFARYTVPDLLATRYGAVARAGGWRAVRGALPASHFTMLGGMNWSEALGYFFPTLTLMVGNQTMYQKFFSAKSERDARLSVAAWIGGTVALETIIVLLAMVGGVISRSQIESGALPTWGIIPYTARHAMLPLIGAIFLGAVFAKVLSTGNNYLFSPATSVVHDVFQRFFIRRSGDRSLLLMSRITVVVLGLLALAQSFQPSILATAVYAYDVYGAGITPAVVAAFFWKRATTAGGLRSICAGTLMAVAWKIARFSSPMIFPALAASLACLIGVSLLTPPPGEEQWRPFFKEQG